MTRGISRKICSILLSALTALACLHSPALATPDEDLQTLEMFYEGKDLVVSATRSPKPISQTAENITVITAADIEMMGAHTLPEVLNNVPGLQTDDRGSIATFSGIFIQGADPFQILVLQDGVVLNFIGAGLADIAPIPVQNIERIEIIKGVGSSAWGSALGGVINIVTKSPREERKLGGTLSASIGEKLTRDSRGEASGTVGRLGYYLFAGNLASDGLRPHTALDLNNLYAKLQWELPNQGSLLLTTGYTRQTVGEGQIDSISLDDKKKNFLSTLSWHNPLSDKADLDVSLRITSKRFDAFPPPVTITRETTSGGSVKLTVRENIHSFAAGVDYDHVHYDDGTTMVKSDPWGVFLNDTVTLGQFALTPGIRYDRMNPVGDFISPSMGVAWNPNEKTTLRAYVARGYGLPVFFPGVPQEKVFTVQTGVETAQLSYLWLKATLFLNYISDHQTFDSNGNTILIREQKQGAEVEARTVPVLNTSLSAGYTFIDATNRDTGETLQNIPSQIVKLGVHYDDREHNFKGALLGRYVWWKASDFNATYKPIIWDLNLAKKVLTVHDSTLELFFSAHNLFNGAQYDDGRFQNARRWVEGGLRCNF
jgi:vitamin B12 transporter